jgi:hypothetical protein
MNVYITNKNELDWDWNEQIVGKDEKETKRSTICWFWEVEEENWVWVILLIFQKRDYHVE